MLLSEKEINDRLTSSDNLLNKLARITNVKNEHHSLIQSLPPSSDVLIPDLSNKLNGGNAKAKALRIMNSCLDSLASKIPEVKPEKLAHIVKTMNEVVTAEDSKHDRLNVQVIVYKPEVISEEHFTVIDA